MKQAKRRPTKIRSKAVGGSIFDRFSNFYKWRPEVADDVILGLAVDYVGLDVLVNLVILGQTVLEIYDCLSL